MTVKKCIVLLRNSTKPMKLMFHSYTTNIDCIIFLKKFVNLSIIALPLDHILRFLFTLVHCRQLTPSVFVGIVISIFLPIFDIFMKIDFCIDINEKNKLKKSHMGKTKIV